MATHDQLEETWGVAATHAEHHINDHIRYSMEGQLRTGSIIWICAHTDQSNWLPSVRYVVQPDEGANNLDLVYPGNILVDEVNENEDHIGNGTSSPQLEHALIEMLATLSVPIIVKMETDDNGQPFYVWHIGESTPQQPFGLYVGTGRQFVDALKLSLEKLIQHARQQQ